MVRIGFALLSLAVGTFGAGCSKSPGVVPVRGTVYLDGSPLIGAAVAFHPEDGGLASIAVTDEEGDFYLSTQNNRRGAVIGTHKVAVSLMLMPERSSLNELNGDDSHGAPSLLPDQAGAVAVVPLHYGSFQTSELKAVVVERTGRIELRLVSAYPAVALGD